MHNINRISDFLKKEIKIFCREDNFVLSLQVNTYFNISVMLKKILIILLFPLSINAQETQSIGSLFDSLKTHPLTVRDELNMEKALAGKQIATGKLYPNINLFGSYDYANTPMGMLPIAPNDLLAMVKDQTVPQPFSNQILRVGATISMPVFVKSIYSMAAKAKIMYQSAESKKYIDLLKNEAMIVSLNANLLYMRSLDAALGKKEQSLQKTKNIITIKVNNKRAPSSALLKINNGINQINLMKNEIAIKRAQVISSLASLSGTTLNAPIEMTQTGTYQNGELKALDPLKKKVEADKLGLRAEKEKLWPALMLRGNYNHSMASSYNNNKGVNEDFYMVGLVLKVPVFTMDQYKKIGFSKIDIELSENELAQMQLELSAQADQLQTNLQIIDNSIKLYQNSIEDKQKLLDIAKVSYKSDRMTIEDYLKYEDDLLLEKSKLYKSEAERWQILMKLAVIYGNDIENIVK